MRGSSIGAVLAESGCACNQFEIGLFAHALFKASAKSLQFDHAAIEIVGSGSVAEPLAVEFLLGLDL